MLLSCIPVCALDGWPLASAHPSWRLPGSRRATIEHGGTTYPRSQGDERYPYESIFVHGAGVPGTGRGSAAAPQGLRDCCRVVWAVRLLPLISHSSHGLASIPWLALVANAHSVPPPELGHAVMDLGFTYSERSQVQRAYEAAQRGRLYIPGAAGAAPRVAKARSHTEPCTAALRLPFHRDRAPRVTCPSCIAGCYMIENKDEYWAEGTQSWFNATVSTRSQLAS